MVGMWPGSRAGMLDFNRKPPSGPPSTLETTLLSIHFWIHTKQDMEHLGCY